VATRIRSTIGLELVIRVVFRAFPAGLRRLLAGRPVRVDGQTLDPDLQLLLRLERLTDAGTPASTPKRRASTLTSRPRWSAARLSPASAPGRLTSRPRRTPMRRV
jgi:acetyl esterase